MKVALYILILLTIISCDNHKRKVVAKNQEQIILADENSNRSHEENRVIVLSTNQTDSRIYVDILDKFYDENYYFISLWHKESIEYDNSFEILEGTAKNVLYSGDSEVRKELDSINVLKYLSVANLDSLVVFNADQEIIDTIQRAYYEVCDNSLEYFFLSSYKGKNIDYSNHAVISLKGIDRFELLKSPRFIHDSLELKKTIDIFKFNVDYLYSFGLTVNQKDSISFISFHDFKNNKFPIYLIHNGIIKDSIINEYMFRELIPIPLNNQKEIVYVAKSGMPETDFEWNALISIDIDSIRFKNYINNRYE